MSEIEIGEYVRTEKGKIYTVKSITKFPDGDIHIYVNEEIMFFRPIEIVKHSKNIIDLVEEGDYVNGDYVVQISKELNCVFIETTYYDELTGEEKHNFIKSEDIKSIVTHEQFKNIEYKVGE